MPFITQGPEGEKSPLGASKTNWKFLLIVIILAVIVGGVIFLEQYYWMLGEEPKTQKTPIEKYCEKDEDCACGIHKTTKSCFYGNKNYVDIMQQCPDFCTGIGGNFQIKCVNKECKQISTIQDETANWKTYRNEEYGFEVKYPSSWLTTTTTDIYEMQTWLYPPTHRNSVKNLFNITFRNKLGEFYSYCGAGFTKTTGVMTREVEILENVNDDSINTLIEKYRQGGYRVEIVNLGGLKAADIREEGIGGNFARIYTIKNNMIYILGEEDSCDVSNNESDENFNQILSTFKFIEEFCGTSTYGGCSANSDCIAGGCSGQVCQSKTEESTVTTCEYKDCYNAQSYGLACKCVDKKCQWSK
jgi:eight-cysteine-cluster-containing protein